MCYPNDIFSINLWGGFMDSDGYLPNEETVWMLIDGGEIDKAFEKNGNAPVGFDIDVSFPLTPSQLMPVEIQEESLGLKSLKMAILIQET